MYPIHSNKNLFLKHSVISYSGINNNIKSQEQKNPTQHTSGFFAVFKFLLMKKFTMSQTPFRSFTATGSKLHLFSESLNI